MSNEDKMTIDERRKYLPMIRKRYTKASKFDLGQLLDETEPSPRLPPGQVLPYTGVNTGMLLLGQGYN